jgi:hypothetical protein
MKRHKDVPKMAMSRQFATGPVLDKIITGRILMDNFR